MPTVRCFQMRLSVSRVSYSSTRFGNSLVKSSRKSSSEPSRAALKLLQRLALAPRRFAVLGHVVGQIAVHAARTVIGGVHARAADRLVAVHQLFALAEGVQHHRHRAQIQAVGADPHQMIEDAGDLVEHGADVLRALRRLDAHQPLDGQHVGVFVAHHRHVIQPVHVADRLVERLALRQLLGTAMQQADMRIGADHGFAVHFQDQAQHAVRGRVLRAEIQRVVADFLAAFGRVAGEGGAGGLCAHARSPVAGSR